MRRWLRLAVGVGILASSGAALAWSQGADVTVGVHGHAFHRVEVAATDCTLNYRIFFNAPADAYANNAKTRNVYLFRSRIDFADGKSAVVPIFANRGAGERVYDNHFDTTGDGCWAKSAHKLSALKVEACRGDGCTPESFK
jgi:hypothetical protein